MQSADIRFPSNGRATPSILSATVDATTSNVLSTGMRKAITHVYTAASLKSLHWFESFIPNCVSAPCAWLHSPASAAYSEGYYTFARKGRAWARDEAINVFAAAEERLAWRTGQIYCLTEAVLFASLYPAASAKGDRTCTRARA